MKNKFCKLAALASFSVALTGAALAQDVEHWFRANIPIDFYVGGQLMPAGEYRISFNVGEHEITIGQIATGKSASLRARPMTAPAMSAPC